MAKIGFILNSFWAYGGEQRVLALIANELAHYHKVIIYSCENRTLEPENKHNYYLDKSICVKSIKPFKYSATQMMGQILYYHLGFPSGNISQYFLRKCFYPKLYLREWIKRINEEKLDIIIGLSGLYTMLLGYIKEYISPCCVGWEHSSFEGYFAPKTGYYRNRMQAYKQCAAKLDCIVVLNNDIAMKYMQYMDLNTTIIYNPKSFSSNEKADMSQKCFVTCGRLEHEKGYDDLIKAFAKFNNKHKEWKLLIIGGGSMEQELRQLAKRNNVYEKVVITGYTQNVQSYLAQGSVFIMTSRWEGFPMTVTEALEMGLPVIAYDIPAMKPLVSDGVEGIIVPAFIQNNLINAMEKLASDIELRERMSKNALKKAESLSPQIVGRQWIELIEQLIG